MAWTELGLGADNRYYYRNGDAWASTGSAIPAGTDGVISDSEIPGTATRGTGTMPDDSWPEVAGWTRTVDPSTHGATYNRDGVTRTFTAGQQGNVHQDLTTNAPPPIVAAPGAGGPGSLPYVNPYSSPGSSTSPFGAAVAGRLPPGANEAMVRDLIPRRTGESESVYQARIMGMSPAAMRDEMAMTDASRWLTAYRDAGIPPDVAYRDLSARGILAPNATPPAVGSAGWPAHGPVRPWHPSGTPMEALPHTGAGPNAHTTREPSDITISQGTLGVGPNPPPAGSMRAALRAPGTTPASRTDMVSNNTQRLELANGWLHHATAPVSAGGLGWTREAAIGAMSNTEPPILVNGRPNPDMTPSDMASRLYTRPEGTAYDPAHPTAGTPISPTYVPAGGGSATAVPTSGTPPEVDPTRTGALAMGMIRHLRSIMPSPISPTAVGSPGGSVSGTPVGSAGGNPPLPSDAAALAGGNDGAMAAYWEAYNAPAPGGSGPVSGPGSGPPPSVGPAVPGAVTVGGPTGGPTTVAPVSATEGPAAPASEWSRVDADLARYGITDPADIAAFHSAYGNASTDTLRNVVPPLGAGETPTAARSAEVRQGIIDNMVHRDGERFRGRFAPGDMDSATADAVAAQMYREVSPPVNPDDTAHPPSIASMWRAHNAVGARIDGMQPTSPATTLSRTDPSVAPIMASATSYYRTAAEERVSPLFPAGTYYANTAAGRGHRRSDSNLYFIHNGVYDSPAGLRSIARTPRPGAGGTDPLSGGVSSFATTLGTGSGASASPLRRNLEERYGRLTPPGTDASGPGWTPAARQQFEVERWRRGNTVEDRVAGENMTREGWANSRRERLEGERHARGMAAMQNFWTRENQREQMVANFCTQMANQGFAMTQEQQRHINQLTLQQLQAMFAVNQQLIAQGTPKPFDIVMGMLQGGRR